MLVIGSKSALPIEAAEVESNFRGERCGGDDGEVSGAYKGESDGNGDQCLARAVAQALSR